MHAQPSSDITSPKTQRRMWRRVWISVALLLVLTPVMLWIAIDQAGKAEWKRAQIELNAKGEAAVFEDLGRPTHAQIPDEENFCALPWLTGNDDRSESAAMIEFAAALEIFKGPRKQVDLLPRVRARGKANLLTRARGKPALGIPRDFEALARMLDLAAEEIGGKSGSASSGATGGDPVPRIQVHMRALDRYWQEAETTLARPQAVWLPTLSDRLDLANATLYAVPFPFYNLAQSTSDALSFRASVAVQAGDYETALRSVEIAARLAEACVNDATFIGGMVAMSIYSTHLDVIVECLWDEDFRNEPAHLLRMHKLLDSWDMIEVIGRSVRGSLVFRNEGMLWTADHRAEAIEFSKRPYADPRGTSRYFRVAPDGWFHNNAAVSSRLLNETLLAGIRSGNFPNIIAACDQLRAQIRYMNVSERIMHAFALDSIFVYESGVERGAYIEATRRQALIICARHRYRLDHSGDFPTRLADLVPDYLEKIPRDPIDGNAMRYHFREDGTTLLYSIALFHVDDGGIVAFDTNDPLRTRPDRDDYFGDWLWPNEPLPPDEISEKKAD